MGYNQQPQSVRGFGIVYFAGGGGGLLVSCATDLISLKRSWAITNNRKACSVFDIVYFGGGGLFTSQLCILSHLIDHGQ